MGIAYFLMKLCSLFIRDKKEFISGFFRRQGMNIGNNCNICCDISTTEPYLITLGNNVTVVGNVTFVTHDNSISKVEPNATDLMGRIVVGDNCFLGNRSMILYGVSLADNIIVAAGAVVTKSFYEGNVIIAGNPAKVISTIDSFRDRCSGRSFNLDDLRARNVDIRKVVEQSDKLIQR